MPDPHPLAGTPRRSRDQVADLHFMDARQALPILLEGGDDRVAKILHLWSDPSLTPIEQADTKSASGVWPGLK